VRRPERRTNQRKGGSVKLIREAIQAGRFVRGSFWDSGGKLREGERDLEALMLGRGERCRSSRKRGRVAGSGEKGILESSWSEASAVWR
jgi:hypothetical protein